MDQFRQRPSDEDVILVIEDDRQVRLMLARILTPAGFAVTAVASGGDARRVIGELKPDLVVLDLGLPDEDGFALERWIRKRHPGVAILILTGNSSLADRVKGLEGGADDYVVKPFMPDELIARIRSIIRRVRSAAAPVTVATSLFMGARVDVDSQCLHWDDGRKIHLTAIEFAILTVLAERPGRTISRDLLLDHIGADEDTGVRAIDYHVCQLRAKLKAADIAADAIRAVRGLGYAYHPPGH